MNSQPAVTVIALCFNHSRFVLECLESIRAQSFQDFQLVVTDDASTDDSASQIEAWLATHYPQAIFIRHQRNRGLCATLNEALRRSVGEFISMIATDDAWEVDKISRQVALMRRVPASVAVVYSDAHQMNEHGQLIDQGFLAAHGVNGDGPSGRIFSRIADGNFIPAMSTLIRRAALTHVGGYDERLTYEDFDMWLRLSSEFEFVFLPARLARYRVHSASMVRTIFARPTPAHSHSVYLIAEKWLRTDRLDRDQRKRWAGRQWEASYNLYLHDDPRAAACLLRAFQRSRKARIALLALTQTIGLTRTRIRRFGRSLGLPRARP